MFSGSDLLEGFPSKRDAKITKGSISQSRKILFSNFFSEPFPYGLVLRRLALLEHLQIPQLSL